MKYKLEFGRILISPSVGEAKYLRCLCGEIDTFENGIQNVIQSSLATDGLSMADGTGKIETHFFCNNCGKTEIFTQKL